MSKGIEIHGNVNNFQIQQNCNDSTMNVLLMNDTEYFEKAQIILDDLLKFDSSFSEVFKEQEDNLRLTLEMAKGGIQQKNKSVVSRAFCKIREMASTISSNMIATAMMNIITNGGIL